MSEITQVEEMNKYEMLLESIIDLKYNVSDMLYLSTKLDSNILVESGSIFKLVDSFLIDFYNVYQPKIDLDIMVRQYEIKKLFNMSLKDDKAELKKASGKPDYLEILQSIIWDCGRRINLSLHEISTFNLTDNLKLEFKSLDKKLSAFANALVEVQEKLGI